MAFSDWNYIFNAGGGGTTGPLATQNSTLNSGLSNPLLIGSSYCRRMMTQYPNYQTISNHANSNFLLSQTYSSGAFYNIPATKAIRIQCHIRGEPTSVSQVTKLVHFGAKLDSNATLSFRRGYNITMNADNGQVHLWTNDVQSSLLTTVTPNTWKGFRLEVYPIGTSADVVKVFMESGSVGSNIWQQLIEVNLSNPSSRYVNWGENRRIGFGTSAMGGAVAAVAQSIGYFDNFSASIANAPTPIL